MDSGARIGYKRGMPTPLNRDDLARACDGLLPALLKDRLFAGGKARTLQGFIASAPETWERFFGNTLAGIDDVYRYAAVVLAARVLKGAAKVWKFRDPKLRPDQVLFVPGDAVIEGNLVLPPRALVVVSGQLRVSGAIVEKEDLDYTLVAAGKALRAKNLYTSGEVFCAGPVTVDDCAWLQGNDYGTIAPRLAARVLIQNDRGDRILKVKASRRWDDFLEDDSVPKLASWLNLKGLETSEEFEQALRQRMLTGKAPSAPKRTNRKLQEQLYQAAENGSTSRVKALLAKGADPRGDHGYGAFQNACLWGHIGVLRLLIEHGVDVNWRLRDDSSGLAYAAGRRETETVRLLLNSGADPNLVPERNASALQRATCNGDADVVKLLLAAGANPMHRDGGGRTVLQRAQEKGDRKILALIRGALRK